MNSAVRAVTYGYPRAVRLLVLRELTSADQEAISRPDPDVAPELTSEWSSVHDRLVSLGKDRAAHERAICRWLLAAHRLGVHARAGYASLREYAERVVGLNGRQTEERLRVGRALAALPRLDAALASGELAWSAARELTRVAVPATEEEWLAWAKGRRAREIEAGVAARRQGDGPGAKPDPSLVKHRLAFEVRAETMALFREVQAKLRAELGGDVDDDMLLFELARRVLGGPTDDGRASYQVAVTRCDDCGRTSIDAAGESHPVDDLVGDMAACDAQDVGVVDGSTRPRDTRPHVGARASQTIPPATRRAVIRRDRKRCVVPGCRNHLYLDVHHVDPRSEGGGHDPDRLAVLCGAHHRAVHAGSLRVNGGGTAGFAVRHGDGTPYGGPVSLRAVDIVRDVVGALEHMGFKPTRARALVDEALRGGAPRDVAALLRATLQAS